MHTPHTHTRTISSNIKTKTKKYLCLKYSNKSTDSVVVRTSKTRLSSILQSTHIRRYSYTHTESRMCSDSPYNPNSRVNDLTNMLPILFLLVVVCRTVYSQREPECQTKRYVGRMCSNKQYLPEDVINQWNGQKLSITFSNVKNDMYLSIPKNYSKSLGDYIAFRITNACVRGIEEHYFSQLDREKRELKEIKFINVKCLDTLATIGFRGLGEFVETLHFEKMPQLKSIDPDFFLSFVNLRTLKIILTRITSLPGDMLGPLVALMSMKISDNRLTQIPDIPPSNGKLMDNFIAERNPFECNCRLMDFINRMTEAMKLQNYTCHTPQHLYNKTFKDVGNLCVSTTSTTVSIQKSTVENFSVGRYKITSLSAEKDKLEAGSIKRENKEVMSGRMTIEIIVAVSGCLLIAVIVVSIALYFKKKKKSQNNRNHNFRQSPSKPPLENKELLQYYDI